MKITVIEANDSQQLFDHIVWTVTASCFYNSSCMTCQFNHLFGFDFACILRREQYINATRTQLPYTFDTDDYPELLI